MEKIRINRKPNNKGSALIKGAFILSLGGIITKIIGAVYRIPLTNILGAEGIGMYQLVFPLYVLLLTISSSGLPSAISRLISEKEDDEKSAEYIFKITLYSLLILGLISSLLLCILAPVIAKMQGNILIKKSYYAIAPSIFFVAGISAFRGYFQGKLKMAPTAFSQIVEQAFKAGLAITFSFLFMPNVLKAVFYTILSVSISEFFALLFLIIYFIVYKKNIVKRKNKESLNEFNENTYKIQNSPAFSQNILINAAIYEKLPKKLNNPKDVLKTIYKISIPVTLASLLLPLSQLIDSAFVVNILNKQNLNGTLLYGLLTGPVFSMVNLPVVIATAIATVALPLITRAKTKNDNEDLNNKISYSFKLMFLISIPSFLIIFLYSKEISRLLYSSLSAENIIILSNLMKICSLSVIFLSLMQLTVSMLIALKKVFVPIITLGIAVVFKIVLNIILLKIPSLNIYGAAISSVICYLISAVLNLIYILINVKCKFNIKEIIFKPLYASLISIIGIFLVRQFIFHSASIKSFLISVLLSGAIFLISLFFLKILSPKDFKKLRI